jgi:hypothetical protein
MNRAWMSIVAVLAIAGTAMGTDVNLDPGQWSMTLLAGDDSAFARLGYTPAQIERVTVGPQIGYLEGVQDGDGDGYTAGFFATYDLVKDAELDALGLKVPITWYIGLDGDALFQEGESVDMTAGLMTGLRIGRTAPAQGQRVAASMGIEGRYALTEDLWQELADIEDGTSLMVFACLTWK